MRNRTVTLIDLGLDAGFDHSMAFVQATLSNVNAGHSKPIVDVNFIRTRDLTTIQEALRTPSTVLHVMAHGDHSEVPAFVSSDGKTQVTLDALAGRMLDDGYGVASPIVIADGCKTGIGLWQRAIRNCLEGPITYVGTSAAVGWHDATVFCSAFYGALTRYKGAGVTAQDQGLDAAQRAAEAFTTLTDRKSPFKAVELLPSRAAVKAMRR